MNMVAYFWKHFSINILYSNSTISDKLTRFLQYNCPKSKTILFIIIQIPNNPIPCFIFIERCWIMLHSFYIRYYLKKCIKIFLNIFS